MTWSHTQNSYVPKQSIQDKITIKTICAILNVSSKWFKGVKIINQMLDILKTKHIGWIIINCNYYTIIRLVLISTRR